MSLLLLRYPSLKKLWDAKARTGGGDYLPADIPNSLRKNLSVFESNLWAGIPEPIRTGSDLIAEVDAFMTEDKVVAVIESDLGPTKDGDAVKAIMEDNEVYQSLFRQLKAAAVCAVSGATNGMQMTLEW